MLGGLVPAVVLSTDDKSATVYVRGHGEVVLEWPGMLWARPYRNENRTGPAPTGAADIMQPGDVVRVELSEEGFSLAQVPEAEGALVSLDPRDGAITAITGGFDFERSKFNRATQARRQPGSNFKPFIYAAALASGFTAASLINDAPVVFDDPGLEAAWRPENYSGKFFGPTRLRWALTKSRNLVSIRLLRAIGVDFALRYVERFGFDATQLPRNLSLALGSGAVTPLELARGYAVLANGGYRVEPWLVEKVLDGRNEVVYRADPLVVCERCEDGPGGEGAPGAVPAAALAPAGEHPPGGGEDGPPVEPRSPARPSPERRDPETGRLIAPRVVPARDVWILDSILRDVITRGTGRRATALGRKDLAGKTGTTNDQRDAWFSGFVPRLVTTTWIGFDQLAPLGRRETGAKAALPIWLKYMRVALQGIPEEIPPRPEGLVTVRIDPDTGALAEAGSPGAIFETFRVEHAPGGSVGDAVDPQGVTGASRDTPTALGPGGAANAATGSGGSPGRANAAGVSGVARRPATAARSEQAERTAERLF